MIKTPISCRQRILWVLLACLPLFVSGCSSVISRSIACAAAPPPPLYLGGVRTDWMVLTESDIWQPKVYGVIDLPFSLAGDVILLPYDIYTDCRHTEEIPPDSE
jgi:uncharacterized protein YceK